MTDLSDPPSYCHLCDTYVEGEQVHLPNCPAVIGVTLPDPYADLDADQRAGYSPHEH